MLSLSTRAAPGTFKILTFEILVNDGISAIYRTSLVPHRPGKLPGKTNRLACQETSRKQYRKISAVPFFRKASKIGGKSGELCKKIERTKEALKDHKIAEQTERELRWVVEQRQLELKRLRKDIPELGRNAGGICEPGNRWMGQIYTCCGGEIRRQQ